MKGQIDIGRSVVFFVMRHVLGVRLPSYMVDGCL